MEVLRQMIEDAKSSKLNEESLRKALITKLNYIDHQLKILLNGNMSDNVSSAASQSFAEIVDQILYIANAHLEVISASIQFYVL